MFVVPLCWEHMQRVWANKSPVLPAMGPTGEPLASTLLLREEAHRLYGSMKSHLEIYSPRSERSLRLCSTQSLSLMSNTRAVLPASMRERTDERVNTHTHTPFRARVQWSGASVKALQLFYYITMTRKYFNDLLPTSILNKCFICGDRSHKNLEQVKIIHKGCAYYRTLIKQGSQKYDDFEINFQK